MKGLRLLTIIAIGGAFAFASAAEKMPTWLIGKFKGHSAYLQADYEMNVDSNGIIIVNTITKNGHDGHFSGKFHGEVLDIGKKVYRYSQSTDGVKIRNIWHSVDQVDLKRVQ